MYFNVPEEGLIRHLLL